MKTKQVSNGKADGMTEGATHPPAHGLDWLSQALSLGNIPANVAVKPTKALRTQADLAAEWSTFLSRRYGRHAAYWSDVIRCRSLPDIMNVQDGFLRAMTEDYRDEWLRLSGKVGVAAQQAVNDLKSSAAQAAAPVNAQSRSGGRRPPADKPARGQRPR